MQNARQWLRRLRFGGAVLAVAAAVFVLFFLAFEVTRKLQLLETASSDNVQWALSQTEVEFLELELSVAYGLQSGAPDLRTIRREFDIFYSRVQTISESTLYAALREDPVFAAALAEMRGFLDAAVAVVDSPDAEFAAELAAFDAMVRDVRVAVRALSVAGLEHFAREADLQREGVAATLLHLAVATVALLSVLLFAALVLARLYRLSEQRANELHLASSRMQTVIGTSLDAIVVADRAGRIVEFNPAAEKIFGRSRAEVLGRDMGEMIVPEKYRAAHEAGMERYRRTGEKRVIGKGRMQLEAQRADGSVFPVELSIQSAKGASGELFVSFIRDISRRLAAERELVEARDHAVAGEKAKTEFLAVMSHELRTPLNGLLGALSLLKDTRLSAKQRRYTENMDASGALLLHHINDVLDITKYEAGKLALRPEPVVLADLVQSVVDGQRDLAAAADNVVGWQWCGTPVETVRTDPQRLRQVLVNLVGNAVKFTQGGRITIEVEAETPAKDGRVPVMFRVIDTGIGIDPDDIERVFKDFETVDASYGRRSGGSGLGLGIARRVAGVLGGEIGAESTPGEGSVFWLRVPFEVLAHAPDRRVPSLQRQARAVGRKSVLVIEDNEINRVVLREMLAVEGHIVAEAHNGRVGVARAEAEAFDLILMDISMPVMDGIAAARAIRAGTGPSRGAPIIAVTAHAMPREIESFLAAGMSDCISKPIDRADLRRVLSEASIAPDPPMPGVAGATKADALTNPSLDRLDELSEEIGPEALQRLAAKFLTDGDAIVTTISNVTAPDWSCEQVVTDAHKLAGAAAIFGASALHHHLTRLETTGKLGGDVARLRSDAKSLPAIWLPVRQQLMEVSRRNAE